MRLLTPTHCPCAFDRYKFRGYFVIAFECFVRQYLNMGGCLELLLLLLPFGPCYKKQAEEKGKEPGVYIIKVMWILIILGFIVAWLTGFLTGRKPF